MTEEARVDGLPCPVCKVDLVMAERQGVEIDYCPKCRGVWLDRGELDKIVERAAAAEMPEPGAFAPGAAAPGVPPPPGAPFAGPQPQPGYGPGGGPHGHEDQGHGGYGYGYGGHGGYGGGHGGYGGGHGGYGGGYGDGHGRRRRSFLRDLFD